MDNTPENNLSNFAIPSSAPVPNNNLQRTVIGSIECTCNDFDHLCECGNKDGYLESFPPGYRFSPSDQELVCAYLLPKVHHKTLPRNRFHTVNVYSYTPERLSELFQSQGDNWFFFTERTRKYARGKRPNRAVIDGVKAVGYWKATGPEKPMIRKKDGKAVGTRCALVYHTGKAPKGEKQPWIMHEFIPIEQSIRPDGTEMKLDRCVLCKIYRKSGKKKEGKKDKGKVRVQDQNQTHQVGNEDQGLVETSSPESAKSHAMNSDKAKNNFPTYNLGTHEYVNGYLPLHSKAPYYPYHQNMDMFLPNPSVLYGNNSSNNGMCSFEPMPVVGQQQQFQYKSQSSQDYDYGCHSSEQLFGEVNQVLGKCNFVDQSSQQQSNDVNQFSQDSEDQFPYGDFYESGHPLY